MANTSVTALSIWSGATLEIKPSLPVLIPNIGILLSLTYDTEFSRVPSPPILNNTSALFFKSSWFVNVKTSFLNLSLSSR